MAGAMKLTNSNYPTYLEKTTRDRIVRAALAIENTTPEGGILVIFQMRDSTKETLFFHQPQATALLDAFRRAQKDGRLPPLKDDEHDMMMKLMPYPTKDDFNMNNDLSRHPGHVTALVMTNAIVFDFAMLNGSSRRFALPLHVARFLAEYVEQAMRNSPKQHRKAGVRPHPRTLH
jgi:hypothetical protein